MTSSVTLIHVIKTSISIDTYFNKWVKNKQKVDIKLQTFISKSRGNILVQSTYNEKSSIFNILYILVHPLLV